MEAQTRKRSKKMACEAFFYSEYIFFILAVHLFTITQIKHSPKGHFIKALGGLFKRMCSLVCKYKKLE